MGLIKSRPRFSVRAPAMVYPGEKFDAELRVDARREVKIDALLALFKGSDSYMADRAHGYWSTTVVEHRRLLLAGAAMLPKGASSYAIRLDVPPMLAQSFTGRLARTSYFLEVHASIPWWPDRRVAFELHVGPPRAESPEGKAVAYSTAPDGPRAKEPYVDVSLATNVLESGELIEGAYALGNTDFNRYREVEISLVGQETMRGRWGNVSVPGYRWRFEAQAAESADGRQVPFRARLPQRMQPSARGEHYTWEWFLEVKARVGWTASVTATVPITVLPAGWLAGRRAVEGKAVSAPPAVGSDRVHDVWSSVGAAVGLALDETESLRGRRGDCEVVVRREHRGRAGVFLVGALRWPSLHLDLDARPRGKLGDLLGGLEVSDAWLTKHCRVTGRHPEQVAAVARLVGPALEPFDAVHLDDDGATLERRDAGQTLAKLAAFARGVLAAADAVVTARAAIPPPLRMASLLPDWNRLAARLDASLETSRMAVAGRLDGMPAEVRTEWSGSAPLHTVLVLRPDPPPSPEYALELDDDVDVVAEALEKAASIRVAPAGAGKGAVIDGAAVDFVGGATAAGGVLPEAVGRYSADARAVLARLLRGALAFTLAVEGLTLVGPAPLVEVVWALDRLDLMARLAQALRTTQGPYR
jgi:hypothetical protein